jgi:hypothetical protein
MNRQRDDLFRYLSPEARVQKDHYLRAVRSMTDETLSSISPLFDAMYARTGRLLIPMENCSERSC